MDLGEQLFQIYHRKLESSLSIDIVFSFFSFFREEMEDVVGSVFDLMGRTSDPILEEEVINSRVDYIFEVRFK